MSSQLALGALPIRLTPSQIVAFHARHPVVLTMVGETKALIAIGLYDYDYNPYTQWKLPGVIPPWGMQVDDSQFGKVTVFPARNGEFYYTGQSPELGTNEPPYKSPTYPDGIASTIAGDVVNAIKGLALPVIVLFLAHAFISRGNK